MNDTAAAKPAHCGCCLPLPAELGVSSSCPDSLPYCQSVQLDRTRKNVFCILRGLRTLAGLVLLLSPLRTTPAPRVMASLSLSLHCCTALKALPACLAQDLSSLTHRQFSSVLEWRTTTAMSSQTAFSFLPCKTILGAVSLQDQWSRQSQSQKVAFSTIEKTLQSADRLATLLGT